jgi:perosamine synthetase
LRAPYEPLYARRTWQSYCVRVDPHAAVGRTELMRRLLHDGIPTRRGVMAIHEEGSYDGPHANLEHTEAAARDVLMLPLFPDLTDAEQDYVIDRLAAHAVSQAA